ncbi:MAG: hypothetical protein IJ678_06395 [Kiritimatiellae bacterium]|nr:hypothetical protein [Kiritimatiellia bacterium]
MKFQITMTAAVAAMVAAAGSARADGWADWFTASVSGTSTGGSWSANASEALESDGSFDSDTEVTFTPAVPVADTQIEKIEIPVTFTAGTTAPSFSGEDPQTSVYTDGTDYFAYVKTTSGGDPEWVNIGGTPDTSESVTFTLTFDYAAQTVTFAVADDNTVSTDTYYIASATAKTAVASVGFTGTGVIGDFTGTLAAAATISGTAYATFAEAISSAGAGDTVTLQTNWSGSTTVPGGSTVTIDTNGKTGPSAADFSSATPGWTVSYVNGVVDTTPDTPVVSSVAATSSSTSVTIAAPVLNATYSLVYYSDAAGTTKTGGQSVGVTCSDASQPITLTATPSEASFGKVYFKVQAE